MISLLKIAVVIIYVRFNTGVKIHVRFIMGDNEGTSPFIPKSCQKDSNCPIPLMCIEKLCISGFYCRRDAHCDPRFECKNYRCVPMPKWRPNNKLIIIYAKPTDAISFIWNTTRCAVHNCRGM
ncbi:unnamed protein product [Cylicocyclus nassatus]|uniref:Uncharacterized protein n=1 Tax=Cylicocyclus nassatus TaxID=53992 RepID=A0AA36GPG3_CYLNA|nr:unnamed protein product [Cylicocyclus nassatus]